MPHMRDPDSHLTIGEVARESGLTASALRFYDREGVLVPADVDPLTGYRRYAVSQVRAARLLASLRRIGMPLVGAGLVLDEDARGAAGAAARSPGRQEPRPPGRQTGSTCLCIPTPLVPGTFPDYRSILDPGLLSFGDGEVPGHAGTVDVAALQPLLPVEAQTVGLVVLEGSVRLADPSGAPASVADVYVDPEFLHEALAVAGSRPILVLDGPHRPLAIRGSGVGFSVLMPVAVP